jgi:hypothetical protein
MISRKSRTFNKLYSSYHFCTMPLQLITLDLLDSLPDCGGPMLQKKIKYIKSERIGRLKGMKILKISLSCGLVSLG